VWSAGQVLLYKRISFVDGGKFCRANNVHIPSLSATKQIPDLAELLDLSRGMVLGGNRFRLSFEDEHKNRNG
jgi:hypothetical protein